MAGIPDRLPEFVFLVGLSLSALNTSLFLSRYDVESVGDAAEGDALGKHGGPDNKEHRDSE